VVWVFGFFVSGFSSSTCRVAAPVDVAESVYRALRIAIDQRACAVWAASEAMGNLNHTPQ